MKRFEVVKEVLDRAVGHGSVAAHGAFWRSLTREAFVEHRVFGQQLVEVGDGSNSNLVKALRGEAPFGSDIGTAGALFRRMPAGRIPMPESDIAVIAEWIDDGCPDEEVEIEPDGPVTDVRFDINAGGPANAQAHNDFWRDFDAWAMFQATDEVRAAINAFFGVFGTWNGYANGTIPEANWVAACNAPEVVSALKTLSDRKIRTVRTHYGNPVPLLTTIDAFERFGNATLPGDLARPDDPNHNMNGAAMWFAWSAFADACIRTDVSKSFWIDHARNILVGLINDGLFRNRFNIVGFDPGDPGTPLAVRIHARNLQPGDILVELARRFGDTSGTVIG